MTRALRPHQIVPGKDDGYVLSTSSGRAMWVPASEVVTDGLPGGLSGQILTVQPDLSFAWEDPSGAGLPAGGTTGQVLTKVSATDYDADWETPSSGGAVIPVVLYDWALGAGSIAYASTSWGSVDTASDLVIAAATGDVVEVSLNLRVTPPTGVTTVIDVASRVGGTTVNYLSSGTNTPFNNNGVRGWTAVSGEADMVGSFLYTVQAGDLSSGTLTLRLMARNTGSGSTSFSTSAAAQFAVKNLGH